MRLMLPLVWGLILGLLHAVPAAALTFNITSTGNAQADAAFAMAGAKWSALFSDNITVNITAGYAPLGAGILGSASSETIDATYSSVKSALASDALTANDFTAVGNLPAGSALTFRTNDRSGGIIFDNNNSINNSHLDVTRANAKAIGLIAGNDAAQDASITFSNSLPFDFDPSNDISAGMYDFVGIAAHEIGHALGFVSGVDIVDYYSSPNGPQKNFDLNGAATGIGTLDNYAIFSVLDLYRYSTNSIVQGSDVLDLAFGDTPFFSIDGSTNLARFATGSYNGDGRQTSHWKDNLGIGIMDPTAGTGELLSITSFDRLALDVIGYNPVPEPSGAVLTLILATCGFAYQRRKGQRSGKS